jgi:hypothetical protein
MRADSLYQRQMSALGQGQMSATRKPYLAQAGRSDLTELAQYKGEEGDNHRSWRGGQIDPRGPPG